MKRLAAVSALALTGVLAFGGASASAQTSSAPRPSGTTCAPGSASGSGEQKISSLGPQWTPVGITVPVGAHVTSIVVTTGDDYTGISDLFGRTRVTDNQKQEQGRVWVGGPVDGTPLGGYTQDVPETGAGGDPLKASITTTVFTGNVAASGEVVVWHNNNTTTANSFFISSITVSWTCGSANGGGGSYPPGADAPGLSVVAPPANTSFSATGDNLCDEPVTFTLSDGQSQTVTPSGGSATVTFNGVPAGDYTVSLSQACGKTAFQSLHIEAASSGGGGGTGVNPGGGAVVTTTTVVASQTPVATTIPAATATTVAPQVGSGGVAPTTTALGGGTSGTNAALPATGSDSFSVMQVAFFAIAAGLGLVFVASARRRKGTSAA